MWQNVIKVFAHIESEKRWVQLAILGLTRLPPIEEMAIRPSTTRDLKETLQPILLEIRRLRQAKKIKEADALQQAVEALYRDDPERESLHHWLSEI
jgi:hypothetical protein